MEGKVETKNAVNSFASSAVEVWPLVKPPSLFPVESNKKKLKKIVVTTKNNNTQKRKQRHQYQYQKKKDLESWNAFPQEVSF